MHTRGRQLIPPDSLGTAVTLTTVKTIHKKGPVCIQNCRPYTAATVMHCHSPKKGKRKKK
jgi:hypothetical protein